MITITKTIKIFDILVSRSGTSHPPFISHLSTILSLFTIYH